MNLEVLSRKARGTIHRTPLLFVHGAYVGAWCWEENFLDWFAERGYPVHAVSLRGHGESHGHDRLPDFGLADYAEDVARVAAALPRPPVLIGHSMGALVVQKYFEKAAHAPAMILASPVPSYGLLPSSFALAFTRPALFASLNTVASGGPAAPGSKSGPARPTAPTGWCRRGSMEPNPGSAGWSVSPICRARPRCRITARRRWRPSPATSIRTTTRRAISARQIWYDENHEPHPELRRSRL